MNVSSIISDGMVLQRHASVTIWGNAAPGQAIDISFVGEVYRTATDAEGNWQAELITKDAGGPYEMAISADGEEIMIIRDILIGEVWVLGGQSNMQLPVGRTLDRLAEQIREVNLPQVRQFTVPQRHDFHGPRRDLTEGRWISATSDDVLDFSAAGFFFAQELHRISGIPVGLILTAIGGTPVEAWMSEPTLRSIGGYDDALDRCKDDAYVARTIEQDEQRSRDWHDALNAQDQGMREAWHASELADDAGWQEWHVPGWWRDTKLADIRGAIWFRRVIDIPEAMASCALDAKLMLGTIVDADEAYVNGVLVGETGYRYPPRRYTVPRGVLRPGKNVIAIRVISTHNKGAFIPDMPYKLVAGEHELELSGAWQYRIGAVTDELSPQTFFQYKPAGLYNGMIVPISRYRMRGILWYQGESNTAQPAGYARLFESMVRDWRGLWGGGDFPFLYTQLANFDGDEGPQAARPSPWAELREEQRQALRIRNTAMAVTIDIGEHNDLHPQDKKTLGLRLALAARKIAYGEDVVYSGPLYAGMDIAGDEVRISFEHVGSGLVARGGGELRGFEIRDAAGDFVEAHAVIAGDTVVVSSEQVRQPMQVRYAWANNPAEANLYNVEGLPASPFRT